MWAKHVTERVAVFFHNKNKLGLIQNEVDVIHEVRRLFVNLSTCTRIFLIKLKLNIRGRKKKLTLHVKLNLRSLTMWLRG